VGGGAWGARGLISRTRDGTFLTKVGRIAVPGPGAYRSPFFPHLFAEQGALRKYSLRRLAIHLVRSAFPSTIRSRPLVTTAATRGLPRRISLQASFRYVVGNFSVSSSAQRPAPCSCELCSAAGFLRRRESKVSQRPLPLVLCCELGASSSVLTHVPLSLLPTPPSCARASTGSHRPRPRP
jgi:hypothetical protein